MEVMCWSVGSIVDGVHASARRRRDADRESVAAGRPEASPGRLLQLSGRMSRRSCLDSQEAS